ncbi:MAG TPA: hypothetical protein VKV32_13930, partial [Stellaceae bacterium]|nr:hypothetical protein [Stellaceae bacterium]
MRPQLLNPAQLPTLFRKEFELCAVKRGETIILLSNLNTRREYILAATAAADELGADIFEINLNRVADPSRVRREIGQAKGLMEALKCADLILTFQPPNFARWQKEARDAGARILSVIIAPDEMARLQSPPGLKEAVLYAAERWGAAREIRLLNDAGTDLTWKRGEFKVKSQYGFAEERGRVDQWGAGHITNYPDEGTANGTVVLQPGDFFILPYIRMIEQPVRLEIRDGFIR